MALLNNSKRMRWFISGIQHCLSHHPSPVAVLEIAAGVASPCFWILAWRQGLGSDAPGWLQALGSVMLASSHSAATLLTAVQDLHSSRNVGAKSCDTTRARITHGGCLALLAADASPARAAVIVCDLVESCGLLNHGVLRDLSFSLQFLSRPPAVTVLPAQVRVPYTPGAPLPCLTAYSPHMVDHHRAGST